MHFLPRKSRDKLFHLEVNALNVFQRVRLGCLRDARIVRQRPEANVWNVVLCDGRTARMLLMSEVRLPLRFVSLYAHYLVTDTAATVSVDAIFHNPLINVNERSRWVGWVVGVDVHGIYVH